MDELFIDLSVLTAEPAEEYHARAADFLSSHRLLDFMRCPWLYQKQRLGLIEDKDSTAFLLIDLLSRYVAAKAAQTGTKFDDLLVPLMSKSLKAVAVVMSFLTSAEAFDFPITGLLTSLGLVGAASALAS